MNKFSPSQLESIHLHVLNKLADRHCLVCMKIAWTLPDSIYELKELNYNNPGSPMALIPMPASVIPVLPITCTHCGHIIFFNAIHVQAIKLGGRDTLLGKTTL